MIVHACRSEEITNHQYSHSDHLLLGINLTQALIYMKLDFYTKIKLAEKFLDATDEFCFQANSVRRFTWKMFRSYGLGSYEGDPNFLVV